jgi:hypothetical protein
MNTAAVATPANVTPFAQNLRTQQPKQQTAKEAIAANVQALIEQLEQGQPTRLSLHSGGHSIHGPPSPPLAVSAFLKETRLLPPERPLSSDESGLSLSTRRSMHSIFV